MNSANSEPSTEKDSNEISLALEFYNSSVASSQLFRRGVNTYEIANIFDKSIYRSNEQVIKMLYQKILRRDADLDGLASHLNATKNGTDASMLANAFVTSKEFETLEDKEKIKSSLFMNLFELRSYGYLNQVDYELFITILTRGLFFEYCVLKRCLTWNQVKAELLMISKSQKTENVYLLRKYWIAGSKRNGKSAKLFRKINIISRILVFPMVKRRITESLTAESLKVRSDFFLIAQVFLSE